MTIVQIKREFRSLPVDQRLELLHELWDDLATDSDALALSDEQQGELKRRYEEHLADPATAKTWDEVRAEIREGR